MNSKLIATITALALGTLIRKGIRKLSETNENKPKFNVDDNVKIHGLPTVYRIDLIVSKPGYHMYHLEGTPDTSLYAEEVLEAIDYINTDDVDMGEYIIPLFDVGDTVQIDGTPEVYRIVGAFPEMIYALEDVATREIIDMDECVLKPFDGDVEGLASGLSIEDAGNFSITNSEVAKMSERKLTPREESSREAERRKQARKARKEDIDNLLDIANWNRKQFEATGDEAFAEKEREQYEKIKAIENKAL